MTSHIISPHYFYLSAAALAAHSCTKGSSLWQYNSHSNESITISCITPLKSQIRWAMIHVSKYLTILDFYHPEVQDCQFASFCPKVQTPEFMPGWGKMLWCCPLTSKESNSFFYMNNWIYNLNESRHLEGEWVFGQTANNIWKIWPQAPTRHIDFWGHNI